MERRLSSRYVYKGRVIKLRVDEIELKNGVSRLREVAEHPGAVVIMPLDDQERVMLVRQSRYAVGQTLLELPAGTLSPGESPEQTARRELREETGYEATEWTALGGFYSAPGFCTEYLHLFVAKGLRAVGAEPEEDEEIEVVPTPLSTVPELIRRGEVRDAKSVAGLLRVSFLERLP